MSRNIDDAISCLKGLKPKSNSESKKIQKKVKELQSLKREGY